MKIGVFSDAHGVVGAFEKSLKILQKAGADKIYFLGDAIGYTPLLGALRAWMKFEMASIKGNHEAMLLEGNIPEEKDKIYLLNHIRGQLSDNELQFIASLPDCIVEDLDDVRCMFVHGSPKDHIKGYVYPDTELLQFDEFLQGAKVVFMGNTHRPFVKSVDDILYVNVGSCGLPRGGARQGSVCLFDVTTKKVDILYHSLSRSAIDTLAKCEPAQDVREYLNSYRGIIND